MLTVGFYAGYKSPLSEVMEGAVSNDKFPDGGSCGLGFFVRDGDCWSDEGKWRDGCISYGEKGDVFF